MDARPLVAAKTGIGHYVYNVLEQLAEIDSDNEYFLYSHLPVPGELPAFYRRIRSAGSARSHLWMQSQLPFWLIEDKIDLFWGGGYAAPLMAGWRHGCALDPHLTLRGLARVWALNAQERNL